MTRHIPVAELAKLLDRRDVVWRSLVMLWAYFDDSGTDAESPVTAFGGYVGTERAWAAIEGPWQAILDEFTDKGVRWFHMAECLAQNGQFAKLERPHVNYIITRLSKVLGNEVGLQPMFSAVVQDDWDAVVADAAFLKRFPKPIDLCFDDIVRSLAEWGAKKVDGELIAPVFAYSGQYAETGRLYGAEPWYRSTLGPLTFDYPERVIPLQGADLFAHQQRFDIEKRSGGVLSGPTYALAWATGSPPLAGHWFDAQVLKLTVQRFNQTGAIW